ncbi:MAG: hypothetical protein Q9169_007924 [Polycauliona sp. 2 TL-2023]
MDNMPVLQGRDEADASTWRTYKDFYDRLCKDPHRPWDRIPDPPTNMRLRDVVTIGWTKLLRRNLTALYEDLDIDQKAYHSPRRKARNPDEAELAKNVAQLLYPSPSDSTLPALIKYQKDITLLRRTIAAQQAIAEEQQRSNPAWKPTLKERIKERGNWYNPFHPSSYAGPKALPMPVQVSSGSSLEPFFFHLRDGGGYEVDGHGREVEEPYYRTEMGEWEKGMLYQDGRMDLCKKVVGPDHIGELMKSLESNTFVRHFLLGNNIIGPVGAKEIASYLLRHPNQMETWYLAGNCLGPKCFNLLAERFSASTSITNIWLKRNPLGPSSAQAIFELIADTRHLRTLDLDQTELGDDGVTELFRLLVAFGHPYLPLRHLYLNANGIGVQACRNIATYLAMKGCPLESLYISNNPLGDLGAVELAKGLKANSNLVRLSMRSCGMRSKGAIAIMEALNEHPNIITLNPSHSYATEDLESRYNYLTDEVKGSALQLLDTSPSLRFLDFGITGMSVSCITAIANAVETSRLLVYRAESVDAKLPLSVRQRIRATLVRNVKAMYGQDKTYEDFEAGEQRWLISPPDVRFIDSGYRNRDAGLARRGLMILDKYWEEPGELAKIINSSADEDSMYDILDE